MRLACALAWLATTVALEARWTPAGDGPARFSKRYRDQQGIGALSAPTLTFHHPCSPCWRCGRRLAVDQRSEKRRRLASRPAPGDHARLDRHGPRDRRHPGPPAAPRRACFRCRRPAARLGVEHRRRRPASVGPPARRGRPGELKGGTREAGGFPTPVRQHGEAAVAPAYYSIECESREVTVERGEKSALCTSLSGVSRESRGPRESVSRRRTRAAGAAEEERSQESRRERARARAAPPPRPARARRRVIIR